MNQSLRAVANEVERDSSTLERELVEIDLLLGQTRPRSSDTRPVGYRPSSA